MSIPPPHYSQLYQAFFEHISYYKHLIQDISDQDLHQLFDAVLMQVDAKCRAQKDLGQRNIQDITASADKHIRFIFKSIIFAQMPIEDQDKCRLAFSSLKADLSVFQEIVEHKTGLENEGLDRYLKTTWGRKQLEQLAKVGDPWALQTLRSLIAKHESKAVMFLFSSYAYPLMAPLFLEFKDDRYILDSLNLFLAKSESSKKAVYGYIEIVLKNANWKWGEQALEENFKRDKLAANALWNIFKEQKDMSHFVNRLVMDQFFQDTTLGIEFVVSIALGVNSKAAFILEQFVNFAAKQKSLDIDMLLLSFVVLSHPDNQLEQIVENKLEMLEQARGEYPGCYKKIIRSLSDKRQEIDSYQEPVESQNRCSPFCIARMYQLFALRTHRLIHDLCQEGKLEEAKPQAMADYFPKTAAIIVGFNETKKYFPGALAELLKSHQVQVSILCSEEMGVEVPVEIGIQTIQSNTLIGIWLQDYSFISQVGEKTFFKYPMWSNDDGEELPAIIEQRILERFPRQYNELRITECDFVTIGQVNKVQDQLDFLDYILRIHPQIKNQQFQFTYNEGGNCLRGEHEGKPYALIGKDALAYNQIHLRQELAQVGLKKNDRGLWQLEDSYDQTELNLTDEDMKYFFARDLDIPDPDQIYFIEQADYHLDMAMCLMGGKTIILNDSQLSYERMKLKVQIELQRPTLSEKFRDNLLRRLNHLYTQSRKKKLLEDAAEKDLEKSGFTVIRFAGVFEDIFKDHPELHKTNFFNHLSLTTSAGTTITICLGSEPVYQSEFEQTLKEYSLKPIDHVYFLDYKQSKVLLSKQGGLHCILKCLPYKI